MTSSPVRSLVLYSTSACHLCELAEELITTVLAGPELLQTETSRETARITVCNTTERKFVVSKRDIAEDDELLALYGVRIPVLSDPLTGRELGWPFDAVMLLDYLSSLNLDAIKHAT